MKMTEVDSLLAIAPVIPVVTLQDAERAVPLAQALLDGGIRIIEVTLRSEAALDVIGRIARQLPSMTVLAGTVCSPRQVLDSLQAGASGLVSPGLTERLATAVESAGARWLPGIASASDILRGLEHGLDRFKLFPASIAGGPAALRAFAGPFPGVKFCPTGGIDQESAASYLALGNVACVGGSWLAPQALVQASDWEAIRRNARIAAGLARRRD
jgi:2-dehydro-3-deoxyphosphogluconate aldolase/(4S)-4-hydroxy-2-oxoglutarate aldolase